MTRHQQEVIITNHAFQRMSERMGLSKKSAIRVAEKVYNVGITHSETTGNLNKWVTRQYFISNKKANNIRLYGDKAFIFIDKVLITVIQIPHNLVKDVKSQLIHRQDALKRVQI